MLFTVTKIFAAGCASAGNFFSFPTWYKYLVQGGFMLDDNGSCSLKLINADDWAKVVVLIAMGVLDILLRLAGMVAVGYIIYGGAKYMFAYTGPGGGPQQTKEAQETVLHAVIGLFIAIIGAAVVSFIGKTVAG